MATLILEYVVTREDMVELHAGVQGNFGNWQPWIACGNLCSRQELLSLSQEGYRLILIAREVMGDASKDDQLRQAEERVAELQDLGRRLRTKLIPDEVAQRIREVKDISHVIFRCNPLLNGVPFDLVLLWDDFICFKYATGKELQTQNRPMPLSGAKGQLPYRAWSLIVEEQMPECTRNDFIVFRQQWLASPSNKKIDFTNASIDGPVNSAYVGRKLQEADFINVISHHEYNENAPEQSGYPLGEELFTAEDLRKYIGSPGAKAPYLILSVSCESGVTRGWEEDWPREDRLHGMVDAVLRCGVRHYVSTLIKIPACRSPRILRPFYEAIISGWTVGESLRQARSAMRLNPENPRDGGTVLGLAFVLYGNPADAYFCANEHRTDNLATVTCSAMQNGRACGRVVCQKDGGFATARCDIHWTDKTIRCSAGHIVKNSSDLVLCTVPGCSNVLCQKCSGWGKQLCWEHYCYNGHEIKDDSHKKTCSDPYNEHPDEKRSVCINDDGWMLGLCNQCLARQPQAPAPAICPHCGRYIDDNNPWYGVCEVCNERMCKNCGPFHDTTRYCPGSNLPQSDKDAKWLEYLNTRAQVDNKIASPNRVAEFLANAEQFETNIAQNLDNEIKRSSLIRQLLAQLWDVDGFHNKIVNVKIYAENLDQKLLCSLEKRWALPNDPNTHEQWQPPAIWLSDPDKPSLAKANRLKVHRIRRLWGSTILVAVATLAPVEFVSKQGPVWLPCDATILDNVVETVRRWWREDNSGNHTPDIYVVALAITGWDRGVNPQRGHGLYTILATSQGGTFEVRTPPLAGEPRYVRHFVPMLTPVTVHQRREHIRKWITNYLNSNDFVTAVKVQDQLEAQTSASVSMEDVLGTFDEMVETNRYIRTLVNGKEAIRLATPAERSERFISRWWVAFLSWLIGVMFSVAVWQIRPRFLRQLPDHWISKVATAILCAAICHVFGQKIKKHFLNSGHR